MDILTFNALSLANHFLRLAKEDKIPLTNIKLQKLIYFAHGHWLALFDQPLLNEAIQAFDFGPIIQSVYDEFKIYGNKFIKTRGTNDGGKILRLPKDENGIKVRNYINEIWNKYKLYSGNQLSYMATMENTPWRILYQQYNGNLPKYKNLDDQLIKEYFKNAHCFQLHN